ncbi:MAG: dTMP kinase [Dehalococcoidia bacterium]|nr:dTMP kinase [Dehalococcoidia bacterium]
MNISHGLFITFEGCEGCGKSTHSRLLYKRLLNMKIPAILTQEPGGTPLGMKVRELLKVRGTININPMAELLLFNSCRTQLISDVINPALAAGKVVICDRFADSTVVYQGYGRGLDMKLVFTINDIATGGLEPDLTILLDTEPATGLNRKRNSTEDRFEAEGLAFHNKIRNGYLELMRKKPGRWLLIEPGMTIEQISDIIWKGISPSIDQLHPPTSDVG